MLLRAAINVVLVHIAVGVFLYLPTASGAGCPQRVYPMTSPDTQWNPLVHKQLRGLNRQKQDGVVFRDFQVT